MRLIDADSIRGFAKHIKTNEKFEQYIMIDDLSKLLDEQPTAYNIGKVVAELEQKKEEVQRMRNTCVALSDLEVCDIENVTYERAIEIVKQGGVSDYVCEWQRDEHSENDNPAECIICPHKPKRIFSKDIKYCPYCGKKIKVVE